MGFMGRCFGPGVISRDCLEGFGPGFKGWAILAHPVMPLFDVTGSTE